MPRPIPALRWSLLAALAACAPEEPIDKDDTSVDSESDSPIDTDDGSVATPQVRFVNAAPFTTDDLVAELTNPDPAATYIWRWTQSGTARPDLNDLQTVPATQTRKLEPWRVSVVATKGGVDSDAGSAEVTVLNSPPTATVTIGPDPATAADDLVAEVTTADADEEEVNVRFAWSFTDTSGTVTTAFATNTIGAGNLERDQVWTVTVVPFDVTEDGAPVTDSIVISNSPPVITAASLTPLAPRTTQSVTGQVTAVDPDGDGVRSVSYAWFVNGTQVTGTTSTLADTRYDKGDEVWFTAKATDFAGAESGAAESNHVFVANTPPEGSIPQIGPAGATVASTLTCTPVGFFDVDNDPEGWRYAWQVGGVALAGQTSSTLDGSVLIKGQSVTCTAAAFDGTTEAGPLSSSVLVISNAAPSVAAVSLSPAQLVVGSPIVAVSTGVLDADGDTVSLRHAWTRNGVPVVGVTGPQLSSGYAPGDAIRVTVTPTDGAGLAGPSVSSVDGFVQNRLSEVTEISLLPTTIRTNDTATATATATDPDGQAVTVRYRWRVNNQVVREVVDTEGDGDRLPSSAFVKGDQVQVTAIPNDGLREGTPRTAGPRTVANTVPFALFATISPPNPVEGSTITCSASGWNDPDGDAANYIWRWNIGSRILQTPTNQITGVEFNKGDEITCRAVPFDGTDEGSQVVSATVTVGNTPPVLASVQIRPLAPQSGDTITAVLGASSDVDRDDVVSFRYRWLVDGALVSTGATLPPGSWAPGKSIQLEVRPFDGTDEGTAVLSNTLAGANGTPSALRVTISPASPRTNDALEATLDASDPDGDTLVSSFAWYVDDVLVPGVTGDTLAASFSTRGQEVVVVGTATDPSGAFDSVTSGAVVILNTRPTISGVSVQPTTATESSTLSCIATGWSDADGDPERLRITWYRNGGQIPRGSYAPDGISLNGNAFARGDRITCRAEAFDDDPEGPGNALTSGPVVIGNTPPVLDSAVLSNASPTEADTVTVVPGPASDLDGDTLTYAVRWLVNGVEVSSSSQLGPERFKKGDEIQAAVRPFDLTEFGPEVLTDVGVALNSPPSVFAALIGPSGAVQSQTLTVDVLSLDPDGDALTYEIVWFVDEQEVARGTDLFTLAPGPFVTGSFVRVDVVPNDGEATGPLFSSGSILIGNAPPSITGVTIAPLPVYETSVVGCTASGWFDEDGDPPGYLYRWLVNGTVRSGNPTVTGSSFNKGDVLICRVIPTDGFSNGLPVDSAPTTVLNSKPSAVGVSLTKLSPREGDTVGVSVLGAFDPDGDPLTTTVRWSINGSEVLTGPTVNGALFNKGDVISAVVTLSDTFESIQLVPASTTAINTAPILPSLQLSPGTPRVTSDLTAIAATPTDPDPGDVVTLSYIWSVDAVDVPLVTGALLPAGNFVKHQMVGVRATPNDGTEDGFTVTASAVEVQNTPPLVTAVQIQPDPLNRTTPAECVPQGFVDDDGDEVVYRYEWQIDGLKRSTVSTLPESGFRRGEELRCFVDANDGEDYGPRVGSPTVTVGNSPPAIGFVRIAPSPLREVSVAVGEVGNLSDPDGDVVVWSFEWFVNGAFASSGTAIDGSSFSRGDTVRVVATPNDGFDDGPSVQSETVTVANTPPTVVGPIVVTPTNLRGSDTITVSAGGADIDGDPVTLRWTFLVDGVVVQNGASNVLQPGPFVRGDVVQVRATPNDTFEDGASLSNTGTVVQNSVPTVPTVAASPTFVNPGVDAPVCSIVAPSTDADGDALLYQFQWRSQSGLTLLRAESASTTNTLEASFVDDRDIWTCTARAYDGFTYSNFSSGSDVVGKYPYLASCEAHRLDGGTSSGLYTVDPDGQFGSHIPFQVWCDQSVQGGGWVKVLALGDGQDLDVGQRGYSIVSSYAGASASSGVYEAFRQFEDFRQVLVRQVTGAQAGRYMAFGLNNPINLTLLEYLEVCRDEPVDVDDDFAFGDFPASAGHTPWYSGRPIGGDLQIYRADGSVRSADYFFLCGHNESENNDVAYLSVSDEPGFFNSWGDNWRGTAQIGTIWSFANGDYCCGGNSHIGAPGLQTLAGWKGQLGTASQTWHQGTYEIFVR